jgi:hypothetical protein
MDAALRLGGVARWDARDDRKVYAVWLALIWAGMIAGFGLDFPGFLEQQPPPPLLIHVHAVVFVGWLVFLTAQVTLVQTRRFALHRRLGLAGLGLAAAMMVLGPATALTVHAQIAATPAGDHHPQFLAVNFVDILGFGILLTAGVALRANAAAHKRLMMLSTVALCDPGFGRLADAVTTVPDTFAPWLVHNFYGNVLLIAAMGAWDLLRRGSLHPAFVAGSALLILSEIAAGLLYFDPAWKTMAAQLVRAWGYAG